MTKNKIIVSFSVPYDTVTKIAMVQQSYNLKSRSVALEHIVSQYFESITAKAGGDNNGTSSET